MKAYIGRRSHEDPPRNRIKRRRSRRREKQRLENQEEQERKRKETLRQSPRGRTKRKVRREENAGLRPSSNGVERKGPLASKKEKADGSTGAQRKMTREKMKK